MSGRDPHEEHRVATPLELLFDLTFVIAFGVAASQFAHLMAEGHVSAGLAGFGFSAFAIWWAWMNFTWFASAYDTDDWIYRVMTMLQMVGVIILAIGIPPVFASIEHGGHVDNVVMVAGYVVMRIALVGAVVTGRQAGSAPPVGVPDLRVHGRRRADRVGGADLRADLTDGLLRHRIDADGRGGQWPRGGRAADEWHPVARPSRRRTLWAAGDHRVGRRRGRHGGVLDCGGGEHGWSTDAILLVASGIGLTFGMWWVYFLVPAGALLHAQRTLSFWYGYLHLAVFAAIVATGAGLHVAAYYVDGESKLSSVGTVLAVAIPVGIYLVAMFVIYSLLVRDLDLLHALLLVLAAAVLLAGVVLAAQGTSMAVCLLVVTAAPVVVVVGFEAVGHRHAAEIVGRRLENHLPG